MAFEINGSQPPNGARPISNNYFLAWPESQFNSGQGIPIAEVGRPGLTLSFPKLKATGWNWWVALTGDAPSVAISSIQFYNPFKSGGADWDTWTGGAVLHRPTYEELSHGVFEGVEIKITEMVES
jgi:hypothetical protein